MLVIFLAWEISHVQVKNVNELSDLDLYNFITCEKRTLMLNSYTFRRAPLDQTPSHGEWGEVSESGKSHRQVEFVCFSPSPLYTKWV